MENRENDIARAERKAVYLCNGEAPYCKKKMCYKTEPLDGCVCKYTTDVKYALNFRKEAGAPIYYEKMGNSEKKEKQRLECPRTIDIDGVEIPTYQTLWEKHMKTNLRVDRCVKTLIVIAAAEAILALMLLFK